MPRRRLSEKATRAQVAEWAKSFDMPAVESVFTEASRKAVAAFATNLSQIIAQNEFGDLFIVADEDSPGHLIAYFGGENSSVTPHVFETTESIDGIVRDIIGHAGTGEAAKQYLAEWRRHFADAVGRFDEALSKLPRKHA